MKRRLSLLVACFVTFSVLFTACGSNNNAAKETTGGVSSAQEGTTQAVQKAEDGPLSKYDQGVEIHVARSVGANWEYPKGDDINNNIWYRDYEKTLGIKVVNNWVSVDSEYQRKLNVTIASGSLPELFVCKAPQLKQLVEAGQLSDLTQAYDTYASDLTKRLQKGDGGAAIASATFQGKLYALPIVSATIYNPSIIWVRMDWLKKLNLPEPKKMDDILKIAEAFVKNDPDGNNKSDTFGLALSKDFFEDVGSLKGFANGYHAYPQIWVKDSDSSVSYGSLKPEMKTMLAKVREMYQNNLIDKEFGVKDSNKVAEDIIGNRLGLVYGLNWLPYMLVKAKQSDPTVDWKAFPSPSIDGGPAKASVGFTCDEYTVVTKASKHPEAAIKMLNMHHEIVFGSRRNEKEFITTIEDGKGIKQTYCSVVQSNPSNDDTIKAIKLLLEAIDKEDKNLLADAVTETDKYDPAVDYKKTGNITNWAPSMQVQAFGVLANNYPYENLMSTVFGGQTQTMAEKWGILNNFEIESFTKIIMGASPIDDFDKFVTEWNQMGGSAITKEINDALNAQK